MSKWKIVLSGFFFLCLFVKIPYLFGDEKKIVEYHLRLSEETLNFTGKPVIAMTINSGIPGPTLYFTEGDLARIHVKNEMKVETSIHWHGMLLPPGMDGVPFISFPPIQPGETFDYEFPVRQSGTYWYHSHTMLQEQRGVYGAIVIEPKIKESVYDREHVIVLSDWSDRNPHSILHILKRGSEWFSIQKGTAQSLLGSIRVGKLKDYLKRELLRMPAMDLSDVAYDRFLSNGESVSKLEATAGEKIRLRIVNGSAATFYYLEFAGGPMKIITADGQPVEPVQKQRFLMAIAETYDIEIKLPDDGAYEFRATAHDGSAITSTWIGSGKRHPAPAIAKPNLYSFMGDSSLSRIFALTPGGTMGMANDVVRKGLLDSPGMHGMGGMNPSGDMSGMKMKKKKDGHVSKKNTDMESAPNHKGHEGMKMEKHAADAEVNRAEPQAQEYVGNDYGLRFGFLVNDLAHFQKLTDEGMSEERPGTPYADLRSLQKTSFAPDQTRRDVRLTLDGDMERFIWMINGKTLSSEDVIRIKEGEIVRFIMINRTMMHHPMHLHGHFFRVINKQGDYSPLKHTVDVEPMSTTVIEFNATEKGDWFFHCHILYHMEDGMARVVEYENFSPDAKVEAIRDYFYKSSWFFYGRADVMSHMTEGMLTASNSRYMLSTEWEYGWQNVEGSELEVIPTGSYYVNRFFSVFAGADLIAKLGQKDELEKTLGILGLTYQLPLIIQSRAWVDHEGGARIMLGKHIELTPRFSIFGETEYDTHTQWEGEAGATYMINQNFSLIGKWHSDYGWGGGLRIDF